MTLLGIVPSKIKGEADKPAKHDYCKAIRELPIGAIDTAAVLKVLTGVWQKRPETATRIRSRIENVLDAAKVAGLREGENPARWKGGLQHLLPARMKIRKMAHQPALPYADVPAFVRELRQGDGIAAACLEFQILTIVRPGNAVRCRWAHVDRNAQTWTIPAGDMKGGEAHAVPLSDAALAVLDRMAKIKHSDFVFPSTMGRGAGAQRRLGHLSDNALASVIDRLPQRVSRLGRRDRRSAGPGA
jgi:integrase